MRPFVLASLATLLVAHPAVATAQQASPPAAAQRMGLPIVPGTRVRVSATTLVAPLIANFFEMRGDTAVFIESSSGRGIWTFTLDQITKLERSAGEQRQNKGYMVKGGLVGFGAGAVSGLLLASTLDPADKTRRFNRVTTASAGGVLGAVAGALIGSRFSTEGWDQLPLPHRMTVAPTRRGLNVGLSLSF